MRISAIILAAGVSSRMGQAKQLLPLGGSTVLAKTIENVRLAAIDELLVVLGASAETIRHQLPPEALKFVLNPDYQEGMATSLRVGLAAVQEHSNAALIVLGDQPFIRPQTLNQIIEEYRRTRAQIIIPTHRGNRGNPVLLDRSVFSEVMALEGDIGCRAIFTHHLEDIVKIEVEDEGILLDLDRPEDYDRLKE
jgi:molybdenum cofactor cytidylyltransferase